MKVLALSDIHARWQEFPPERMPLADLVLVAGDLTDKGSRDGASEVARAEHWLKEMACRYALVYWVPGNHDIGIGPETFCVPGSVVCALGRTVTLPTRGRARPLTLRGVSLCPAYDLPELVERFDYTTADPAEEEHAYDFEAVDVVLSHCPPLGILDFWTGARDALGPRHIGSRSLASYIHRHRPRLVVCGHVHNAAGRDCVQGTQVCNVAGRCEVLEL